MGFVHPYVTMKTGGHVTVTCSFGAKKKYPHSLLKTSVSVIVFPLTPTLKKLQLAAGRCRHQIKEVDQTRIIFKIILVMTNNKHHFIVM
jgi:hypothetical protein